MPLVDFLRIVTETVKQGVVRIYPDFNTGKRKDLMLRGNDFYAIWDEEKGMWSTDEDDVIRIVDREVGNYAKEYKTHSSEQVIVQYMKHANSGVIDRWHKYCKYQERDNYHQLDSQITFADTKPDKEDYVSMSLPYAFKSGSIENYDLLMSTLYSPEERHKIEWAVGAVISGEAKHIQKFLVLYGDAGTGKSTVLHIIEELFTCTRDKHGKCKKGYWCTFDAKSLGSANSSFPFEAFVNDPLVAIQHDGDLSRIEDNTRLNSLVSHESVLVNTKYKSAYPSTFNCMLFMGTNKPVKITDAKSGILRRLIDVSPSGNKLPPSQYDKVMSMIKFELGAIAYHCQEVFLENPRYYDGYTPLVMLNASNDFYNFVSDTSLIFERDNGTTLKAAWALYKDYCEEAKVPYPHPMRIFQEELKNYFDEYYDRYILEDGTRVRKYYQGFKSNKFETFTPGKPDKEEPIVCEWLSLRSQPSVFDEMAKGYLAQFATADGIPTKAWDDVKTTLSDISTGKLHYVKVPENHIVIDFDLKDESGNKSAKLNLEAASRWPKTYAEFSKSGAGVHLHYIYTGGDPTRLSRVYSDGIEIKVFSGKSSLRRKLTKCNDIPVANISSGLPMKGEDKVIDANVVMTEKSIRKMIERNLRKEIHPNTKPSIDFIYKILEDAYNSGVAYDVSDMRNRVMIFAINSTNNSDYCLEKLAEMHFKSEEAPDDIPFPEDDPLVFYDVEVFPNLFLVNWKVQGPNKPVVRMINPTSQEIEEILHFKLVGFNCRQYDNHMLYARLMGYSNEELYRLSQHIVNRGKNDTPGHRTWDDCFFSEAYNISYTDIYDFASAAHKMSLKKLEIEMGIHHQELGLPWDEPVPESQWERVAEYCDNDVLATEAAFEYLKSDWTARQILADWAGLTVNDKTNTLTAKIIFGNNKHPQSQFHYRDLAQPVMHLDPETEAFLKEACPFMMAQRHGPAQSLLPYFPGYTYEYGKSYYWGEDPGEGGYVYADPGIYKNVALLDIASMHPHSAIAEVLFGERFTRAFREIVEGRVSIKHEAWDEVDNMLDGKLKPYIEKVKRGEMASSDLANALKTAINSVYGLTSAKFPNQFKDERNVDNIVAKRGALFMINLKHEVMDRGFTVAHIKTDSIKIPDATPEIIKFVIDYGRMYGYEFEHEATYERMCLVNDAVYIAKFATEKYCMDTYGYSPKDCSKHGGEWTATGKQFAVPYVYKTLFSKEPIVFEDLCETKSVQSSLYLDMNEDFGWDESVYRKMLSRQKFLNNRKDKILTKWADLYANEADIDESNPDYKKYQNDLIKVADINRELETLNRNIEMAETKGHAYHFIGKVGQFCPIKPNAGGGLLVRESKNANGEITYSYPPGAKGYRWLESETVRNKGGMDIIDLSYYNKLVDEAVETISSYGDFEWFTSDDMPVEYPSEDDDEIPF